MKWDLLYHYTFPKSGNTSLENEDFYKISFKNNIIVLSDGASESIFAGEWAKELCTYFSSDKKIDISIIDKLGNDFQSKLSKNNKSWYLKNKVQNIGAAASLLQIKIKSGIFKSFLKLEAVGDSCALLFRSNGKLEWSFPITKSEDFNNKPDLVYSIAGVMEQRKIEIKNKIFPMHKHYLLLIASDALAATLLKFSENHIFPTDVIYSIKTEELYKTWIQKLRSDGLLKNDDTTLIAIKISK